MTEREQIVAWLRAQEKRNLTASHDTTRSREISTLSMAGAYGFAAKAIERGDHLPAQGTQP